MLHGLLIGFSHFAVPGISSHTKQHTQKKVNFLLGTGEMCREGNFTLAIKLQVQVCRGDRTIDSLVGKLIYRRLFH